MRDRRAGSSSATRLLWVAGSAVSVLFIIAVSYAFYGERGAANTGSVTKPETIAINSARKAIQEVDTDEDGVPDWEELLWDTDPNRADTDGDGVPDTRAVRSAVAWRDAYTSEMSMGTGTSSADNTTTVVARELFGSYMNDIIQKGGANLSPEEQAVLIDQTIQSAQETFKPPTISADDLRVVAATDETRVTYATEMIQIFNTLLTSAEYDYELMRDLPTEHRQTALDGLGRSVALYATTIEKLKNVAVPSDAAENHTSMVSAFMGYSFMVESIKNMESDPVRAAAAVNLILQYDEVLATTIDAFEEYAVTHVKK